MNCGNYRGIKALCHSKNLCERVHRNRLRNIVSISAEQFGLMKGKVCFNFSWITDLFLLLAVHGIRKIPPHVNGNINMMIVQPAMLYEMETIFL